MLSTVKQIVSQGTEFPQRLFDVTAQYIFFLSVYVKDHTFESASKILGLDPSRYSHLLNEAGTLDRSRRLLNRAMRRKLTQMNLNEGQVVIIIDSTLWKRTGKKIENRGAFNHGKGSVFGHKIINIVRVSGSEVVPICSLPYLSESYCKDHNLEFKTENDIVTEWINDLPGLELFPDVSKILFLMDAGYDCKKVQKAILGIGAHFVAALKTSRTIEGQRLTEYFRSHRNVGGQSIRLFVGSGGKRSTRNFSVRHACGVFLKGVGTVSVVCSKKTSGKKKYLVSSDSSMTAREIVLYYSWRWLIESWHRTMKQNFGFIDCRCTRFAAIEAHINFSLIAYHIQKQCQMRQLSEGEFVKIQQLKKVKTELNRFGGRQRIKNLINEAIRDLAS